MQIISYFAYIRMMIAILTGDITRSEMSSPEHWMPLVKGFFKNLGKTPKDWEIYRGDAFQLQSTPEEALLKAIHLKSIIKQQPELDVRISIGIGDVTYKANKITESNGSAFILSGRKFDTLKEEKLNLAIATGNEKIDEALNVMARFSLLVMDNWSVVDAEIVQVLLEKPTINQQQIADILRINQSAVSQRRKRAQFDLLMDFNEFYKKAINEITT